MAIITRLTHDVSCVMLSRVKDAAVDFISVCLCFIPVLILIVFLLMMLAEPSVLQPTVNEKLFPVHRIDYWGFVLAVYSYESQELSCC